MTSIGRPEGAMKYICRSPLRLLNMRSAWQPFASRYPATFLRSLDRQAKSMSWSRRSRGGYSGHRTRTARPPSSLRPSPSLAASRASVSASGSGSWAEPGVTASAAPGTDIPSLLSSLKGARWPAGFPGTILLSGRARVERARRAGQLVPAGPDSRRPPGQTADVRRAGWLTPAGPGRHPCCMIKKEVAPVATYQSAERVLTLLKSFDDGRVELGVAEIARALSVHMSTASRLAAALERTGFLIRVGKRYRLGVEIIRLGTLALRSFDLVATMQPAMEKLSRRTGETVNLAVPDGGGAEHLHPVQLGRVDRPPDHAARGRQRQGAARLRRARPAPGAGALHPADDHQPERARHRARHGPPQRLRHGGRRAGGRPDRGGRPGVRPDRGLRRGAVHLGSRVPDAPRDAGLARAAVRQRVTEKGHSMREHLL